MMTEKYTSLERTLKPQYSEKAKDMLLSLGISFRPGSFRDNARIAGRDSGVNYTYNVGFSPTREKREDWIIIKDDVEIGFYFTGLKTNKETEEEIGEVGVVHLAPGVRDKHLFTPIYLLGLIQLLEKGAEKLQVVIDDETGKVEGVNKKLGFIKTEKIVGYEKKSVWEKNIPDQQEKLNFFMQEFEKRFLRLKEIDLSFDPKTIDIDNPKRISIKETVLKRLEENPWNPDEEEGVIFGYSYAPVVIFQEYASLLLRVRNATTNSRSIFEKSIKTVFHDKEFKIFPFPTDLIVRDFETQILDINTAADAEKSALKLVEIWEIFDKQISEEMKSTE